LSVRNMSLTIKLNLKKSRQRNNMQALILPPFS
jgi:hypothetical protein